MQPSFLKAQFQYMLRGFGGRKTFRRKASFMLEVGRLLRNNARMQRALAKPAPPIAAADKKCVVVLLSHNRPQNLPLLVLGALQNSFVSKVIVSNSNTKFRIRDWVNLNDSRLVLIDEQTPTAPGHRFVLADREPGDYFLSIDDDIFLTPPQWAAFFETLLADPEVPHGITGHIYRPGVPFTNGSEFHHIESVEAEVDVLIGAYAFTRTHLQCLFAMAETLGISSLTDVGNGEDIMLSFAGRRAARIHDLGPTFLCASTSLPGVALWATRQAFWNERVNLLESTRRARLAMTVPWLGPATSPNIHATQSATAWPAAKTF
jgi:hypothetical protein